MTTITLPCADAQLELVPFHFGEVEGEARAALEAHLATCPACVAAWLAVKREIELAEHAPAPSAASLARLRDAVAREVGAAPRPLPRPARRWEPVVAFAAAAMVLLFAASAVGHLATTEAAMPHGLVAAKGR